MTDETEAIGRTFEGPVTAARLAEGLARLGVRPGDRLLTHASLSAFGFVAGGAQAVVEALRAAVGPGGLVVMPAFTGHLSEPDNWNAPAVPESWRAAIRDGTPAFDPRLTPSYRLGAVAELFRTAPGAARGPNPQLSFAAWGRGAEAVVSPHPLEAALGDGSPLARLYDLDASVLFLGTGYGTCTAFHLAEHRAGAVRWKREGAPVVEGGARVWRTFDAPVYDTERFEAIGAAFEAQGGVATVEIGAATCRLFGLRAAVEFAAAWISRSAG